MGSLRRDEAGLTLVEILIGLALIMIGLVAVMRWYPFGTQTVETGRQQLTSVFLAEEKLEQISQWAASTAAGQGFASITSGSPSTAPCCAPEGYNSIPGYTGFRRQVTVSNGPDGTKEIRVQVFYRPLASQGIAMGEAQVQLVTLISN